MRIFISAPFFSKNQVAKVKKVEKALRLNPSVTEFVSPRLDQSGCGYDRKTHPKEWARAVYRRDVTGVQWADASLVILDMDGHDSDSGSMYEMGLQKAYGKPTYTVDFDGQPVNLMQGVGSTYDFHSADEILKHNFSKPAFRNYKGDMC